MQFNKEWMVPAIVGTASFVAGTAIGYFLIPHKSPIEEIARKVEELEEKQLEFDFEKANRDHAFNSLYLRSTEYLEEIVDQIAERDKQGLDAVEEARVRHPSGESEEVLEEVNVFATDEEWNYEEEELLRDPEHPYTIHRDEFFSNEMGLEHVTLEYYAGDNILTDAEDVPVYGMDDVVGYLRFGHGSLDPSIVYIRNEKLKAEYEVLLNEGSYQADILGEDLGEVKDIKHSLHKFRLE